MLKRPALILVDLIYVIQCRRRHDSWQVHGRIAVGVIERGRHQVVIDYAGVGSRIQILPGVGQAVVVYDAVL